MMMVITRMQGEALMIGDDTSIEVLRISENFVAVGITTPSAYRIVRLRVSDDDDSNTPNPSESDQVDSSYFQLQ